MGQVDGGTRDLEPPGGHPPPRKATIGDAVADLEELATEICRRYRAVFPDEEGRYGDAGLAWCVHDNQHLLNWAVLEVRGFGDMNADVSWLASVLEAREFPLDRLAHDLEIAADVVGEDAPDAPDGIPAALRRAATLVRETPTFRPA